MGRGVGFRRQNNVRQARGQPREARGPGWGLLGLGARGTASGGGGVLGRARGLSGPGLARSSTCGSCCG